MTKVYREDQLTDGEGKHERWVRLPSKPGERLQGQSRATLYNWMDAGLIKSANIKRKGCLTGIRVIWLPSLMAYIESFTVEPEVK